MIIRTLNRLYQPASLCSSTLICSSLLGNSKTSSLSASSQVLTFVSAVSSRFTCGNSTIVKFLPPRCFSTSSSRTSSSSIVTPSYLRACEHLDRTAVIDSFGRHSYGDLLRRAKVLSDALDDATPYSLATSLHSEPRVAILTPNDSSYVVATWAAWLSHCIVVPLHAEYPVSVLRYYLDDAGISIILVAESMRPLAQALVDDVSNNPTSSFGNASDATAKSIPRCLVFYDSDVRNSGSLDHEEDIPDPPTPSLHLRETLVDEEHGHLLARNYFQSKRALIIYTSGSTGPPKGVVLTHGNICAQIDNMVQSWEWTNRDLILHVLPLHHVHGIVNCLLTPLQVGAAVHFLPKFDAKKVFYHLTTPLANISGTSSVHHSLFMAVPTIYVKLLQYAASEIPNVDLPALKEMLLSRVRLMVSGSAALPTPVFDDWFRLSGHRLLERYGMTEIGMALSNPLNPDRRIPGCVGIPMPSVEVALASIDEAVEDSEEMILKTSFGENEDPLSGELLVGGPSVFSQYWNKPEATRDSFTADGRWFRTGDTVVVENGNFRIFGRTSVDVIKSGGYKVSALDVERHLLSHPQILDVAVVGIPDDEWGQIIVAVVVVEEGGGEAEALLSSGLKTWAKDVMPFSWIPRKVIFVESIPRNAMGKVNKKTLVKQMFPQ